MADIVRDVVLLAGVALVGIGACLRFGASGLIISGALLMAGSLLHARAAP